MFGYVSPPVGWLPVLVPVLFVELSLVVTFFWWRHFARWCGRNPYRFGTSAGEEAAEKHRDLMHPLNLAAAGDGDSAVVGATAIRRNQTVLLFPAVPFPTTFEGPSRLLLLLLRFLACLFFLSVGIGINTVDSEGDFDLKFFTNWNVLLVSVYFSTAYCCSVIGYCSRRQLSGDWSPPIYGKLAILLNSLFEVSGSTAFLITIVNFTLLEDDMTLLNVTCHLVTSCCLLAEMLLNKMDVHLDHYPLILVWLVIYQGVAWALVLSGRVAHWPYDFQSLDEASCFGWYSGLILGSFIFYAIWYGIAKTKFALAARFEQQTQMARQARDEDRAVAFLEQVSPFAATSRPSAFV